MGRTMTEKDQAIKKIVKVFEIINQGLDKGLTITKGSEQHQAIKLLLDTWKMLEKREKEQ